MVDAGLAGMVPGCPGPQGRNQGPGQAQVVAVMGVGGLGLPGAAKAAAVRVVVVRRGLDRWAPTGRRTWEGPRGGRWMGRGVEAAQWGGGEAPPEYCWGLRVFA